MKKLLLFILLATFLVQAQGKSEHRMYGVGQPKTEQQLPPGRLREQLEQLSPKALRKALRELQKISFPIQDVDYMRIGPRGAILYIDPVQPELPKAKIESLPIPPGDVFLLHSAPGSSNISYIDVDGHRIQGTAWNRFADIHDAKCFDPDEDGCAYSESELAQIYWIWYRIKEAYSIFDVDVTTEDPGVFTDTMGRLLITQVRDTPPVAGLIKGAVNVSSTARTP